MVELEPIWWHGGLHASLFGMGFGHPVAISQERDHDCQTCYLVPSKIRRFSVFSNVGEVWNLDGGHRGSCFLE